MSLFPNYSLRYRSDYPDKGAASIIDHLSADLARVTAERDALRATLQRAWEWMNREVGKSWTVHDAVDPTLWDEMKAAGVRMGRDAPSAGDREP